MGVTEQTYWQPLVKVMRHRWCCCSDAEPINQSGLRQGRIYFCSNARSLLVHRNPTSPLRMSYKSITTGFQLVNGGAIPSIRFLKYIR